MRRRWAGRAVAGVLAGLVLLGGGFLAWPSPIDAVAWRPAAPPSLAGPWRENDGLAEATVLFEDELDRPEHVAVDGFGSVYTGTADGVVHRIVDAAGPEPRLEQVAEVPGRPLGMAFTPDGDLVVAAAEGGLLQVDPGGSVRRLAGVVANSVAVGRDGTVYVTEAADRPGRIGPLGLLEQRPYGRLYRLPLGPASWRCWSTVWCSPTE